MAITCALFGATAQTYTASTMHIASAQGVAKSADTLANGDTGYVFIWVGNGYDLSFELLTTTLTGTVATTSNILYGYNNNGSKLTAAQVPTVTAQAITGVTSTCAGCVGASSTTVPGASKKYTWQLPKSSGSMYDNYFIRTIQTGTCTATYTAKAINE
jgi:hypothetical protein